VQIKIKTRTFSFKSLKLGLGQSESTVISFWQLYIPKQFFIQVIQTTCTMNFLVFISFSTFWFLLVCFNISFTLPDKKHFIHNIHLTWNPMRIWLKSLIIYLLNQNSRTTANSQSWFVHQPGHNWVKYK